MSNKTQNQEQAAKTQDLAAKIARNLERTKEARTQEGSSEFFRMHSGEKTILEFTGDFEAVLREFPEKDMNGNVIKDKDGNTNTVKRIRYEYQVIDYNNRDKGIQTWPVSKNNSKTIDEFLAEGFLTLKVSREGADMGTKYYFVPVQNQKSV
jgi:hypothetical protein